MKSPQVDATLVPGAGIQGLGSFLFFLFFFFSAALLAAGSKTAAPTGDRATSLCDGGKKLWTTKRMDFQRRTRRFI
jgi:hypothetical protein